MITLFELQDALILGLFWGIMALGVYITFRILDFPDLTVEGSFVFGAALAARLITSGFDPVLSTLLAMLAGIIAGLITGFFHTVLKIPKLLSGILTMFGLYSINLRAMGGLPNIPVQPVWPGSDVTVMSRMADLFATVASWFGAEIEFTARDASPSILVGILFVIAVIAALRIFFNTEVGYALRATGDNEPMVKAQGVNTNKMKVFGLMIGNSCAAIAGALIAQVTFVADVNMGAGIIVIGLAAVIIGEVIFRDKNNYRCFVAVVLGSIIYRIIIAFVLRYGNPQDFQLRTAVMIALALSIPMLRDKLNIRLKKSAILGESGKKGGDE